MPGKENKETFVKNAKEWLNTREQNAAISLQMADTRNGWRTDGKRVYHTTSSGKQWASSATFYDGGAGTFVNSNQAFLTAKLVKDKEALTSVSIFSTANGGERWKKALLTGRPYFNQKESITTDVDGFSMADAKNGLLLLAGDGAAGHHESSVFSTDDGAQHFNLRAENLRVLNGKTTLTSADESHAYLFVKDSAAPVSLLSTVDGGKNWTSKEESFDTDYTDVSPALYPIRMNATERIVLLSAQNGKNGTADTQMNNTFYRLFPDGSIENTSAQISTNRPLDNKCVSMPNASTIFVYTNVENKPALFHYAEGKWKKISSNSLPGNAIQVQFVNQDDGFLLLSNALYRTTDGGKTWTKTAF
ncbi:MAG TPA: hypothetical protein DEP42_03435 [Ruminococcaceae bacterium]|nr:hypothetical protein [Oscillospiraceae bacterium]